ncbi:signal recognition particle protein [Myxococcota bacterium]|nr:signal recognition particle protein [Myxococcota bacterium]
MARRSSASAGLRYSDRPMLETLTKGFTSAKERLSGVRVLTDENVDQSLRDVRMSLLEADVDLAIVRDFLARVKERALGQFVETRTVDATGQTLRITPGQHFVKCCEDELVSLMGPVDTTLSRGPRGVTSVMLIGLQGVGKTTVAAKLARHLQKQGRRPLLVAADVQRPAAVEQLIQLGRGIDVAVHSAESGVSPDRICADALKRVGAEGFDAVIYDTAGRLAVDEALMGELREIAEATQPANTLLVCDALMGRDAVNVAGAFNEQLDLDGLVLTKIDGDARGGAALAVKAVTGVPIKFLGTGESVEQLEAFRPEGLASRILGMGDIVGLVRDFEEVVDEKEAEEDAERLLKGQFGLDDLLKQMRTIQKMGPLREVISKLPMFGSMADQVDEGELGRVEALIQSMTPGERLDPDIIDKSRASRIARGSGRRSKDVRDLVNRFGQMREMMSSLGSDNGLLARMGLGGGGGDFDPNQMLMSQAGPGFGPGGGGQRSTERRRNQAKNKRKAARKSRKKNRRR